MVAKVRSIGTPEEVKARVDACEKEIRAVLRKYGMGLLLRDVRELHPDPAIGLSHKLHIEFVPISAEALEAALGKDETPLARG